MTFNARKATEFLLSSDEKVAELTTLSKRLKEDNYSEIQQSIENLCRASFGEVEVHFFGSRIIGLATESSDLDIFLDIGGRFRLPYVISDEHDYNFDKLLSVVQGSSEWHIESTILKTAIPIIKTRFEPKSIFCDINITNGLGTITSRLLAHLFEIQPEAVSLFHFLKLWFVDQGLKHDKDKKNFKGYMLTLLVIFYLQRKNLMPSIKMVQYGLEKEHIDEWEIQFDSSRSLEDYRIPQMSSYKDHIKGFFDLYRAFDYENKVFSTYYGVSQDRDSYKFTYNGFLLKGLYIAGPVNQGRNCGIVESSVKREFIDLCKESSEFLRRAGYV